MSRFHRHEDGTGHGHADLGEGRTSRHSHGGAPPAAEGSCGRGLSVSAAVPDHSGYGTGAGRVEVLEAIFDENDRLAAANRADFDAAHVRVVNLMSSPGAGKTMLLRRTLQRLAGKVRVGIVEGDIETSLDADRLQGFGAAIALVNTGQGFGGECHLDAPMVRSALPRLPLQDLDLVVVENVGNLVCPAEFGIGEHARAMVYSVTEGEDKPLKYPVMFRSVNLVVINKIDLLPHLDFDLGLFLKNLGEVNPGVATITVSARTGEGVDAWCAWLSDVAPFPAGP
ncbi:hydrogenase nickel incorporation protein HypB [Streptomyces cavernae]|uniref:hydrogenase nickel incorporation protein HypB n=1 Tax=Streptomyces cavernae TaxID=2259034 RepID=UPI000FEBEF7B|nr:hydrogenase nickel incorporation protein HypB [Streptomyces cavernae]